MSQQARPPPLTPCFRCHVMNLDHIEVIICLWVQRNLFGIPTLLGSNLIMQLQHLQGLHGLAPLSELVASRTAA